MKRVANHGFCPFGVNDFLLQPDAMEAQKSISNRQNIIDAAIGLIVKDRLLVVAASGEVIAHAGDIPPEVGEP